MNWETLLALGDSITYGARSYLGYPEICGHILSEKLDKKWHVINHSTNGYTTIDLARSLNHVMNDYKTLYPSIITAMIGTNDIKMKVSIENFKIAYNLLITKLRLLSVNNNVLLLKIPPIATKVFYPYNYSMNESIAEFNLYIEKLSMENGLRTVELNLNEDDFFDGVHLNEKGSNAVAFQIAEIILRDKGFESPSDMS
jgi:lysophospholipase L1-like esterase